jgi:hypothetical protein
VADPEAGVEEGGSGKLRTQEKTRNAPEILSPARFCFCAVSRPNELAHSEEQANKNMSQLLPTCCHKKQFDAYGSVFFVSST